MTKKKNMHGSVTKNAAGLRANTHLTTKIRSSVPDERRIVSANDKNLTGRQAEKDG